MLLVVVVTVVVIVMIRNTIMTTSNINRMVRNATSRNLTVRCISILLLLLVSDVSIRCTFGRNKNRCMIVVVVVGAIVVVDVAVAVADMFGNDKIKSPTLG